MATSNAQRQAAYRQRKRNTGDGAGRLDMLVPIQVRLALRRIALHGNESMVEVLSRLVLAEDARIGSGLDDKAFEEYLNRALPGNSTRSRRG